MKQRSLAARMRRRTICAIGGLACLIVAVTPAAADVTLSFATLPSAQGWTYLSAGTTASETDIFSVNGSMLTQDTVGLGFAPGGGHSFYSLTNAVTVGEPMRLELRARVTDYEQDPTNSVKYGFFVSFSNGTSRYGLSLTPTEILDLGQSPLSTAIDNTVFHDYRIEVPVPGGPGALYVDDAFVAALAPYAGSTNQIVFGDGTGAANATADIAGFSFEQTIPEPAAVAGAGALGWVLRRRRRA